jgi:hypothetical protein
LCYAVISHAAGRAMPQLCRSAQAFNPSEPK